MKSYLSVYSATTYEKVIERSRFIANCAHVESEEEAKAFLAKIRAEHSLATHNCYAFVADKAGNLMRFSDDGEPQGTAGMPILDVLKNKKLFETAVVVTRYFGGIKLGTSGLIVASREAAAEAIAANEIVERQVEDEVRFGFEYPLMNEVMRVVKEEGPTIVSQLFDMDCEMTLRIRRSRMENLKNRLSKIDGLHFLNEP